jgi:hypothetical protein
MSGYGQFRQVRQLSQVRVMGEIHRAGGRVRVAAAVLFQNESDRSGARRVPCERFVHRRAQFRRAVIVQEFE